MKLDPMLSEYFRQLNAALMEAVAIYQLQIQLGNSLAEKSSDEEENIPDSSRSD